MRLSLSLSLFLLIWREECRAFAPHMLRSPRSHPGGVVACGGCSVAGGGRSSSSRLGVKKIPYDDDAIIDAIIEEVVLAELDDRANNNGNSTTMTVQASDGRDFEFKMVPKEQPEVCTEGSGEGLKENGPLSGKKGRMGTWAASSFPIEHLTLAFRSLARNPALTD
mmetsp:Transcript_62856/g.185639  ORF Transcript_62856/g.185639 Transcript_62856/m.185639 type:complete len:166 (-) Transcript_62856:79-576(-)